MTVTRLSNSITFKVHDVAPVTNAMQTWKTYEGINALLTESEGKGFAPILSCSGYNSSTVCQVTHHALIASIHTAFAEHRPLVLSPDMLWITLMQGFAQHVRNNSERLRPLLVSHAGKKELSVVWPGFNADSPESDWQGLIDSLGEAMHESIGPAFNFLMCDFSTTGPLERTVCAITILDTYEPYFEYVMYCICGIPTITLEGSPADWRALRAKVEHFTAFDLDWWLASVRPILDQFVRAADGDIDEEYWQNVYKLKKAYGWERINGWAIRLIPYIRNGQTGSFNVPNPMCAHPFVIEADVEDDGPPVFSKQVPGLIASSLPSGLSVVPLTIKSDKSARTMQLIGGFVGMEQVGDSQAIRPKLGWAVRKGASHDSMFDNLPTDCVVVPPLSSDGFTFNLQRLDDPSKWGGTPLPGAISTFYRHCNGIRFGADGVGKFRPMDRLERVGRPDEGEKKAAKLAEFLQRFLTDDMTAEEREKFKLESEEMFMKPGIDWLAFYDLPDGSLLAVDLEWEKGDDTKENVRRIDYAKGTSEVVFECIDEALAELVKNGGFVC
jgi:hypothetical protein